MDLRKAAARVASLDNLEELGMSAEFGPDEGMTSTHTQLEQDDLESFDTRPDQGASCTCTHSKAAPGQDVCPQCGGQLVRLEGW